MRHKKKHVNQRSEDFKKAFELSLGGSLKYTSELDVIRAECILYPYTYMGLNSEEEEIRDRIIDHPKSLGILRFQKIHQKIGDCIKKLNMEADLDTFRKCLDYLIINQDRIFYIESSTYYSNLPQNIVDHLNSMRLKYEQTYQKLTSNNNYILPVRYIIGGIPNNVPNPVDVLNKFGDSGDIFLELSYVPNRVGEMLLKFQMLYHAPDGDVFVLGSSWMDNRMTQIMRPISPSEPVLLKYVDKDPGINKFLECFYVDDKHPNKFVLKIRRNTSNDNFEEYYDRELPHGLWDKRVRFGSGESDCDTGAIPVGKILEGLGDLPY